MYLNLLNTGFHVLFKAKENKPVHGFAAKKLGSRVIKVERGLI